MRPEEFSAIREIICDAFNNTDDEIGIWDELVAHDPAFTPDCARVAIAEGLPVALTVIMPRRVRTRTTWVDAAELTLVGCRASLQGHGYGGAAFRDALAYMRSHGMSLGVFYGEPDYYPRFGCAPVLAKRRVVLPVALADRLAPPPDYADAPGLSTAADENSELEPVSAANVGAVAALYDKDMCVHPCAVERSADLWEWQSRFDSTRVLVLPDRQAYATVHAMDSVPADLFVYDAGAADERAARRLLSALVAEAVRCGRQRVTLSLPASHPLFRLAMICGGETIVRPARPGFAVVTDWVRVLPSGYCRVDEGLAYDGQMLLRSGAIPLTQLAMGYYDVDDLALLPGCSVADEKARIRLRHDFPKLTPYCFPAPFTMNR